MRTLAPKQKPTQETGFLRSPEFARNTPSSKATDTHSLLQLQSSIGNHAVQRMLQNEEASRQEKPQPVQKKPNNTGLPDALKNGVERLSGYAMDDVKVHYNSNKPAQLNAVAYTQGTEIHVAPGQEKHLPHEAWHVVQQKQGRVRPTMQMKGANINDDAGLEQEADVMGAAVYAKSNSIEPGPIDIVIQQTSSKSQPIDFNIIQRQDSRTARREMRRLRNRVQSLESQLALVQRQTSINSILINFDMTLRKQKSDWITAATNVGSAYASACKKHSDAVSKQARFDALMESAAFGLFTASIGGALGGFGEFISHGQQELSRMQATLRGAIEDAIQISVGEGIDVWQAAVAPQGASAGQEPQNYQNIIENAVDSNFTSMLSDVIRIRGLLGQVENEPSQMIGWKIDVEPSVLQGNIDQWWSRSRLNNPPQLKEGDDMEDAMERNIWDQWMPSLLRTIIVSDEVVGPGEVMVIDPHHLRERRVYSSPGHLIEERFDELNITSEAGVTNYGLFWTSESEIVKLIRWAERHTIEDLVMLRTSR